MRFNLGAERAEKKGGRRRPAGSSGEDASKGTFFIALHNFLRKCPGVIIMFFSVVFFVLAMVFGAAAFSGWLRILSLAILVAYVLLAVLSFATAHTASTKETVSLVGTQERTMAYSFLLWVMSLAIYLLLFSNNGVDSPSGIGG